MKLYAVLRHWFWKLLTIYY